MKAVVQELRTIPLLTTCGISDRVQVDRLAERREFASGDAIIREGEQDQALWILLSGECEVVRARDEDGEQQLATIEPGGIFGEMSFLKPAPHSATVRALCDVEVARITPDAFEELRDESPSAAYCILMNLVMLLSDRLRTMDERIGAVIEHTPQDRQKEWHDFRARLFAGWDFN